ncbi:MAG TPA: HNH endonuclease [Nitrospira sp.]|nr:HNH endonuclease [Nitrospira sp.]
MRYWWVNQNQTYKQELGGGYLWSPKRNANGVRNPFYESMREVAPGDMIFSFVDTRIAAIGIAESYCYESPKPEEFGDAGLNWEKIGWRIRVRFSRLTNLIRPKEHMMLLRPLLAARFAPLQPNGNGIQSVYLTEVSEAFAQALIALIGPEAISVQGDTRVDLSMTAANADLELWEHHIETDLDRRVDIPATQREALITARRGQGLFKQRVMLIENHCRITRVDNPTHLRASHCKPWRDSSNDERLNGENGLLLTPSIDHLFDRGFISFQDNGNLIVSPVAHQPSLERMGVTTRETVNVGAFSDGQRRFLEYHRDAVLLKAMR